MRGLGAAAAVLVVVAILAASEGVPAQEVTRLDPAVQVDRDLNAGQVHNYAIALASGTFAFIAVDQQGIDVIVRVTGPDGKPLDEIDSPNGRRGIEPVILFTALEGDYGIEVRPLYEDADPGRYTIGIERLEPVAATRAGRVDQLFAVWDRPGWPGASVGIMQNGVIVYANGYGEAQLEYGVPITPETVFHVASVSKQFTAFAVILLADRGLLSLDDDIRTYLPEVHDFGPTITIRHLIHHVSGLRDQWDLLAMAGWRLDDVITRNQIMRLVERQRELNFQPGDEYLYCNTGYTLLAEIVSRVAGKPFPQFMREEVFEPLGMGHTHFHDDHEMLVPNRAYSYGFHPDGGFRKNVLSYANVGATSLFTTVGDVLRWTHNLDEGTVGGRRVLELMHQRGVLNSGDTLSYAAGLGIGNYRGLSLVGHSGGDAGFRTYVGRFPEENLAVAVFSNIASFNAALMARRVADTYLEGRYPDLPATVETPAAEPATAAAFDPAAVVLEDYVGRYYSAELETAYQLVVADEGLTAVHIRHEPIRLHPVGPDRFGGDFGRIQFERDEDGAVTRMLVSSGRVRNLRFERVAW